MNKLRPLSTLVIASALATYHSNSYTQESENSTLLTPIDVEARLWDEDINQVPGSVSVVQPLKTETADITLVQQATSNVSIEQSSAQTRVTLRGISSLDNGLQDPLGYFVNDIALPQGGNQLPSLFNLESIAILKGPQGTLYGRNTEAGAIKFNSIDPGWTLSSWANLTSGQYGGTEQDGDITQFSAGVSNALVDDVLAGSFAFRVEDSEGAYLNELDGNTEGGENDRETFSAGLTYVIGDNTDIVFKSIVDENDAGRNRFRFATGPNQTDRFVTNANTNGFDNDSIGIHSLRVNHSVGEVELVSITGLTEYEREFEIDLDATPAPVPATTLDSTNDSISQEFRLLSTNEDSPLNWLAGIYLYDEESDIDFTISPMFNTTDRSTTIDQQGEALFGQVEFALDPRWALTIGGRYERIEQSGKQDFSNSSVTSRYSTDINNSEFLSKASLSYQASAADFIYISFAEGYLPGGYNYNNAASEASFTFDPEYSELIELGWKHNNKGLNTTVTLFYVSTDDKQIIDVLPGFVQSVSNAAETESYGLEFHIDYLFTPLWSAYLNAGIQRSEATSYIATSNPFVGPQDLSGNDLPLSPESTYSLGIHYGKPQGLFAKLALRGSSRYYFDSQNTIDQSSFTIVDTEVGYQFKHATLSFWANNIGDEEVISRAVNVQGETVVEDTSAQSVGIRLSANFE